ncbi:hypothetical protein [Agaribacterium haliotis]|uniref:hypothetical protein n=1 Tax=Agaribacterium haliotis TaxID=2013869 RepID=UPI000BB5950A|nr:hypothetical protein [Agaribacterium haliotis]
MYHRLIFLSSLALVLGCQKHSADTHDFAADYQCENISPELLVASYELHGQDERELSLWRNGAKVMHQYQPPNIVQFWALDKNQGIWHSQYFDDYQRGIEYEVRDLNAAEQADAWSSYWQFLPQSSIEKMHKLDSGGEGCNAWVQYQDKHEGMQLTLWWLSAFNLPARYEISKEGEQEPLIQQWQLRSLSGNSADINQAFAVRSNYSSTDFADIGDSEDDPFLAKMIRLGFVEHGASGFYDADGHNQQHAGHHH